MTTSELNTEYRRVAPSGETGDDPVALGVVGLSFGGVMAEQLRRNGAQTAIRIAGLCDLDEGRRTHWSRRLGVEAVESLDRILEEPSIEAVALFTPPIGRAALIHRCIDAGKHVLTTKPFERDSEAARAVLDRAKAEGIAVHLNSPGPCLSPEEARIQDWEKRYALGKPLGARYEIWAGRPEGADGSWYDDEDACPGGVLYRLGIYPINKLIALMGPVEAVQALSARMVTGRPTPDNGQLSLKFTSGALASVYVTLAVAEPQPYKHQMTVNFSGGTVYRDTGPFEGSPEDGDECRLRLLVRNAAGTRVLEEQVVTPDNYQWENFRRAVRGLPLAQETDSWRVVHGIEVVEAMARAVKSGNQESVEASDAKS